MIGIVANNLVVYGYTAEMLDYCRMYLVMDNPEYYQKLKLGKWLGDTPDNIDLFERHGDTLVLPFGAAKGFLRRFHSQMELKTTFHMPNKVDYQSQIRLYDYQREAVEAALKQGNGVIVMPCGSGKTQTALEIVARLGFKALWLTHTHDLLNQSLNRAKAVYGADESLYGTITDGKIDIGAGITFATVQTMAKIDVVSLKDEWDVVIVDECHRAVGSPTQVRQFYKVLSNLNCRYKLGLTATPERTDGLEVSMFALLGGEICNIPISVVADKTCPVEYEQIDTDYAPRIERITKADGTIDYSKLIKDLISDENRFQLVSETIKANQKNGAMLVLANRISYLKRLQAQFDGKSICLSGMTKNKASDAKRKQALKDLNDGSLDCIFATYQLAKEGLDVPNLRVVVFATPEKNKITVTQSAGRVARAAENKDVGRIVDFVDDCFMFSRWAKTRKNIYKKLSTAKNK